MKGLLVLLCVVALAQSRNTEVKNIARADAALGENPWIVHLRVAVTTSGFLRSCVGTLIGDRWVLTTATCVNNVRFIWIRYGLVDVIQPELVTEGGVVHVNPTAELALIDTNRAIQFTENINVATIASANSEISTEATLCGFGAGDNGGPGEFLSCKQVEVESFLFIGFVSAETQEFDIGAPLISSGVQYGVLIRYEEEVGYSAFVNPGAYRPWIESVTGLNLDAVTGDSPAAVEAEAPTPVKFVN